MGRFSPTVKPTSAPSGLAQALQSGVAGFQRERDRMEGQMDRQRKRVIETDTLASQGLVPNLPETPETFGSAFSRALSGAPEPEPQRAVVPGGFVIDASDFEKVDPRTGQPSRVMRLPSGGTYDPSVMEGRLAGTTMAKGLAGNQVQANNRGMLRDEYGQAVVEKGGTLAGAGSQGVIDSFLRKQPSTLKVLGANPGNPAGMADTETGTFTPFKGSNAVPRAGSGGVGGAGGAPMNDVMRLRTDYRLQPAVKNARTIQTAFERISNTQDNAVGDLSLIFGYMKMLDPESVVRETEFANAQNAAGVPDQIRNLWNRVLDGERLNPNQRAQFRSQALQLAQGARRSLEVTNAEYRRLAEQFGIDPRLIFTEDNAIAPKPQASRLTPNSPDDY